MKGAFPQLEVGVQEDMGKKFTIKETMGAL